MLLEQGLQRYLTPQEQEKLATATVGIAGTGGLGANVALLLIRSGLRQLVLIDDDTVDASNLNRQPYFPRHVGQPKVHALAQILLELCPQASLDLQQIHLDTNTLPPILSKADLWIEALDVAQCKRLIVEQCLEKNLFCVSASGIAGYGGPPMQQRHLGENLIIVGDFSTDIANHPPLAPRVMQAAAMQADVVLTKILNT